MKGPHQGLKTVKNKKKRNAPAVCAGILASALSVSAAVRTLPTPPPSEFIDAESSVNVPLPTTEGRHIRLTLDFDPSPTNAVQVAFGKDANADGELAPEETALRVGCDCGVWFGGDEGVFDLKSPKLRWDLAKVTTHNIADTNVTITAKFYSTGFALILR